MAKNTADGLIPIIKLQCHTDCYSHTNCIVEALHLYLSVNPENLTFRLPWIFKTVSFFSQGSIFWALSYRSLSGFGFEENPLVGYDISTQRSKLTFPILTFKVWIHLLPFSHKMGAKYRNSSPRIHFSVVLLPAVLLFYSGQTFGLILNWWKNYQQICNLNLFYISCRSLNYNNFKFKSIGFDTSNTHLHDFIQCKQMTGLSSIKMRADFYFTIIYWKRLSLC